MLLASIGTLIILPEAIPVLAPQLSTDALTIARPLLLFIALPLVIGICIRSIASDFAERAHPVVKKITGVDIAVMLSIVVVLYWRDFIGAVGSYAIAAQVLYYCALAAGAYSLSFGLSHEKKATLALGLCTRNVGAAMAPLLSVSGPDDRATVECIMAVFITLAVGFGVANILGRLKAASKPVVGSG
jgi:BASS family bile acid:Na+ symporter